MLFNGEDNFILMCLYKYLRFSIYFILISFFLYSCSQNRKEREGAISADFLKNASISELDKEILESPDDASLYFYRSKRHVENREFKKAIDDLIKSIGIDSLKSDYHIALADAFFTVNQTKNAKEALERCARIFPDNEEALLKLAELYLFIQKYEESIKFIDKALLKNRYNARAYFMKGMNFKEMKDTARAISSMQTAVEQDPEYYDAYVQLGLLHSSLKNQLALEYYDNALKIRHNSREVLYNKAKFFQDMEQWKPAVEGYKILLTNYPDDKFSYYNLGIIEMAVNKNYTGAIKYFNDAMLCDTAYTEAYFARGVCFQAMEKKNEAKADFIKALRIDPSFVDAENALKEL